jgi:hypothetical protein
MQLEQYSLSLWKAATLDSGRFANVSLPLLVSASFAALSVHPSVRLVSPISCQDAWTHCNWMHIIPAIFPQLRVKLVPRHGRLGRYQHRRSSFIFITRQTDLALDSHTACTGHLVTHTCIAKRSTHRNGDESSAEEGESSLHSISSFLPNSQLDNQADDIAPKGQLPLP